jgi:hypothetical protein
MCSVFIIVYYPPLFHIPLALPVGNFGKLGICHHLDFLGENVKTEKEKKVLTFNTQKLKVFKKYSFILNVMISKTVLNG